MMGAHSGVRLLWSFTVVSAAFFCLSVSEYGGAEKENLILNYIGWLKRTVGKLQRPDNTECLSASVGNEIR